MKFWEVKIGMIIVHKTKAMIGYVVGLHYNGYQKTIVQIRYDGYDDFGLKEYDELGDISTVIPEDIEPINEGNYAWVLRERLRKREEKESSLDISFYCSLEGKDTKFTGTLEFDGYTVGDRLLDGVIFLVDIINGKLQDKSIRVHPGAANYFEGLNQEKWFAAALKGIRDGDVYTLHSTDMSVTDEGGDEIWQDGPTCL